MTIVFQIIAVVVIIGAGILTFRGGGPRHQAIRRILTLGFVIAAGSSVFFPQAWTWVANRLGIGRGADLLLYLLVVVFIGFVATIYRRFRQLESETTQLARQLALATALEPEPGAEGETPHHRASP